MSEVATLELESSTPFEATASAEDELGVAVLASAELELAVLELD